MLWIEADVLLQHWQAVLGIILGSSHAQGGKIVKAGRQARLHASAALRLTSKPRLSARSCT